jgi:hypothetical protein
LKKWKKKARDIGKCLILGVNKPSGEGLQKRKAGMGYSDYGLDGVNPMEEDVVDTGTKRMRKEIGEEGLESMSSGVAAGVVHSRCSL